MVNTEIEVIEDLAIYQDGQRLPLVASRKTRAILVYLMLTKRAHRREALCALFFERTNDPRGALRWSLSKLRPALNIGGRDRLILDADTVSVDLSDLKVDIDDVQQISLNGNATAAELEYAVALLSGHAHVGFDVTHCPDYNAWLADKREELARMRRTLFLRLATTLETEGQDTEKCLRTWWRLEPLSHVAPELLWRNLLKQNRLLEAASVLDAYRDTMGDEAVNWRKPKSPHAATLSQQSIGFCTADDGVRIAYSSLGEGPPLLKTANWLNHLELDWQSPIWADTFKALSSNRQLIRYDERGNGLSDWDVPDLSFDAFVKDLETVVKVSGLDRFPLLSMSQGCAVSIAYAVQNPDRVSALILIGGYASGWRIGMPPEEQERREAVLTLTRLGWGMSDPTYRHIFSQTFMPDADADRLAWFDDFQRQTTSPENAVRFQEAFGTIDVRHMLSQVKVPTLILHAAGDLRIPLDHGRELAAGIPNAKLVVLDSRSHIILGDEPAWQVMIDEVDRFLKENVES